MNIPESILSRWRRDEELKQSLSSKIPAMLDLPSLERELWHSDSGSEPFLSDGYMWKDKPHRVMNSAVQEIRLLRELAYCMCNKNDR